MLSIRVKNRLSKIIRKIKNRFNRKKIIAFIITAVVVFALAAAALVVYYSKDIILYSLGRNDKSKKGIMLKMAEDAYRDGYLENSAVYYQNYLKTNPSKANTIIVNKKLFEINVLKGDLYNALITLKNIELLDPSDSSVYINRVKILIRQNELKGARFEINRIYKKLKKSPEFIELSGVVFMRNGDFEKAVKEFEKIPYRKRGYSINKKVAECYMKLNQISNSISYLNKMEPSVRAFDDKQKKGEYLLLRGIAGILKGDYDAVSQDLRPGILDAKLRSVGYRILIYSYIIQDRYEALNEFFDNPEVASDNSPELLIIVGNYYYYRKDYSKAAYFYEKVGEIRKFMKHELLALTDIYYRVGDYKSAEAALKKANLEYGFVSPLYFKNMSKLRLLQNDFQQGIFYLKQGVLDFNEDEDFYLRLGMINIDAGFKETALEYINEGVRISKLLNNGEYNPDFDVLRIKLTETKDKDLTEFDLLDMRSSSDADISTYFRLIEFYLVNNRLFDAKRELDTVERLPLTIEQKRVFIGYKFIYSIADGDYQGYLAIRKQIVDDDSYDLFYKGVCYFLDGDYDAAGDILMMLDVDENWGDRNKLVIINYVKALVFYYKEDYAVAHQALDRLFEIEPYHRKGNYLKGLMSAGL